MWFISHAQYKKKFANIVSRLKGLYDNDWDGDWREIWIIENWFWVAELPEPPMQLFVFIVSGTCIWIWSLGYDYYNGEYNKIMDAWFYQWQLSVGLGLEELTTDYNEVMGTYYYLQGYFDSMFLWLLNLFYFNYYT